MTDKTAKLPFLVNILITNQGVTLFLSGLFVQDLTPQLAKQLNLWWVKSGVLISGVQKNSPAAEVGIKEGHVLVYVGQYRINDIEEMGALLKIMQKGDIWEVGIVWSDKFGEHQGYARIKIL